MIVYIVIIGFTVAIAFFILIFTRQEKKITEEKNKTLLYEDAYCSGVLNNLKYTHTMRVSIYDECIVFSTLLDKIILHWDEIISIKKVRYLPFQEGISILHRKKELSGDIIIAQDQGDPMETIIENHLSKPKKK